MLRLLLFNIIYVGSCLYALARGGAPERLTALILILGIQLTPLLVMPMSVRFAGPEWGVIGVDVAVFLSLYALAITSARYWPLWMAGLQGAALLTHAISVAPGIIPWTTSWAVALWSYPILILLAFATARHRQRLFHFGIDPAWRWQLPADYLAGRPIHADETEQG